MAAADDVAHLMRRAGFGATEAEVTTLSAMTIAEIVDQLVDDVITPDDTNPPAFFSDPNVNDWEWEYMLQQWWLDRMATSPKPLQERMAFFWHGLLCSENGKVGNMVLMYDQNKLYRDMGMGNFRTLIHTMSLQPAMLHYLDNAYNYAGNANENFARELMELFVLGVNQYTQGDILAAAKAWTGYNIDDNDSTQHTYYDSRHDHSQKTFMGQTRDWSGPDIIDYLLQENIAKKTISAKYIVKKMWTFLAYPNPSQTIIDELAQVFLDNDLEIKPLLRALLVRPEFYTNTAKQGLVRSPVEWVAGIMKYTGLTAANINPQWYMDDMGQTLFEPPNVAGWKNNQYWLNASAMWQRADFTGNVTNQMFNWSDDPNIDTTIKDTIMTILGGTAASRFANAVDYALTTFGIFSSSPNTRRQLIAAVTRQWHNGSWDQRTWSNLVVLVMLSPEFNLA